MDIQESSQNLEEKEKASNRVAKVRVAVEVLENLLPVGTKVLEVHSNEFGHTVDLLISHPSFTELKDGELPPLKQLTIYTKPRLDRVEYA